MAGRSGWARALGAVVIVVLAVLLPAGVASAHAILESSNPPDGSVVPVAPTSVTLTFSEDVQVQPDGVRVIDGSGARLDQGKAKAAGSQVEVPVKALARGSYLVSWRVISADSHPVRGAFTFSVGSKTTLGSGLASRAFAGSADRAYQIAGGVLRVLSYVGALAAAGMVALGALLRRDDEPTPVSRLAAVAAVVGLVGLLGQIPVQAALATGQGVGSVVQPGVIGLVIGDGIGWSTLVTGLGLIGIAMAMNLPFRGPPRAVALTGAALTPLGFALTGHSRTMSPAVIGYGADVAHLVAAAAWFGGLVALVGIVRRRRAAHDDPGAVEAVARFSGWAAWSLALVVVAGTTMGWLEVGGLHALVSTTYGVVLLVKVGLVTLVVALAAWNRYRLLPAAHREEGGDTGTWSALVGIIRFEVVGLVAVLALTGALVNITPAKDSVASGPVSVSAPLGEGSVQVIIDPARVGRNDIHAYILDRLGRPDSRYKTADFALAVPALDIGPLHRPPLDGGAGHFLLVGTELTPGGTWTLTISVQPDRFTIQKATVTFRVR